VRAGVAARVLGIGARLVLLDVREAVAVVVGLGRQFLGRLLRRLRRLLENREVDRHGADHHHDDQRGGDDQDARVHARRPVRCSAFISSSP